MNIDTIHIRSLSPAIVPWRGTVMPYYAHALVNNDIWGLMRLS